MDDPAFAKQRARALSVATGIATFGVIVALVALVGRMRSFSESPIRFVICQGSAPPDGCGGPDNGRWLDEGVLTDAMSWTLFALLTAFVAATVILGAKLSVVRWQVRQIEVASNRPLRSQA